ncbi:DER1-domain-containing protein [Terfezia boudieri ATCC MYA-4762]|uniref:Derlin n=1 Tax=Terfezia boudieri ATCC MYA-4762 TaxID=1051890 RepID=A0A3N4LR01_9PEZI|nr:DER1-domain-containing protein [Terfezia boudieri ATCC MYA-4762]
MSSPLSEFLQQAPPISRTIAGLTLVTSVLTWVFGVIQPITLIYYYPLITRYPYQLWRLVSPFFLTSPKMGIVMDTFFLYRDASEAEKRFVRTGDFLIFTVFVGAIILLLNHFIVGGALFLQALNVAFAYYWSAKEPAATNVNFFIASFSVRYLPYVMLLMMAITKGPQAVYVGATGVIAAHAYIFLTHVYPRYGRGTNIIITPNWVHGLFEGSRRAAPAPIRVSSGSSTTTGRAAPAGSDSAGGIWRQRGTGQRLGS